MKLQLYKKKQHTKTRNKSLLENIDNAIVKKLENEGENYEIHNVKQFRK